MKKMKKMKKIKKSKISNCIEVDPKMLKQSVPFARTATGHMADDSSMQDVHKHRQRQSVQKVAGCHCWV